RATNVPEGRKTGTAAAGRAVNGAASAPTPPTLMTAAFSTATATKSPHGSATRRPNGGAARTACAKSANSGALDPAATTAIGTITAGCSRAAARARTTITAAGEGS